MSRSAPSKYARTPGGAVDREYFKRIRSKALRQATVIDAAIAALERKDDHTLKVHLFELQALAARISALALEAPADLPPNERSEDI